jgi:NADH dehydrogenase
LRRGIAAAKEDIVIVVIGSTGMVGGEVCRRLVARGRPVRAVVRAGSDPSRVEALRALGTETVQADLRDRASLLAACAGADAVVTTVSSMPFSYQPGQNDIATTDLDGGRRLVDVAREAGVRQLVYTSFSANIDVDMPLGRAKRAVEAHLRSSGLDYTILRPSYFQEVWLSPAVGFDAAGRAATVYGDGEAPISWIALGDVAEFAVRSLEEPAARNATLELGGPEALSPHDVVRLFEHTLGAAFTVTHVPEAALADQQASAEDPMAQSFAALMRAYAHGDAIDMRGLLAQIPVALTPVSAFAARQAEAALAGAVS